LTLPSDDRHSRHGKNGDILQQHAYALPENKCVIAVDLMATPDCSR
jgi:hypothetical protein